MMLLLAVAPAHAQTLEASRIFYVQQPGEALPLASRFVEQDGRPTTLREALAGRSKVIALEHVPFT